MRFESKGGKVEEMFSEEDCGPRQIFLNANRSWENGDGGCKVFLCSKFSMKI